MNYDQEIQISAEGMLRNFGQQAHKHARHLSRNFGSTGDSEGEKRWLDIAVAIEAMQEKF